MRGKFPCQDGEIFDVMSMNDDVLAAFLKQPLEKTVEQRVAECPPGQTLMAFLNSVVHQRWAIGCEEIGVARRKLSHSPGIESNRLYCALRDLEVYGEALARHLSPTEREKLAHSFTGRVQRCSDEWRRRNGFVTDDEWDRLFRRFGEAMMVDGAYVVLTQHEAAALEASSQPAGRAGSVAA